VPCGPRRCAAALEAAGQAADLTRAGTHPVSGSNVVYLMHDYSWFHPSGQSQADYFASMRPFQPEVAGQGPGMSRIEGARAGGSR
jgi:hypothetical protein